MHYDVVVFAHVNAQSLKLQSVQLCGTVFKPQEEASVVERCNYGSFLCIPHSSPKNRKPFKE